jgi:hypothetical protein
MFHVSLCNTVFCIEIKRRAGRGSQAASKSETNFFDVSSLDNFNNWTFVKLYVSIVKFDRVIQHLPQICIAGSRA